ncbi:hypothetical protein, partial [Caulobacter sp. 17J65-9]|uniref:hypothetical protein n=1 Tax=Caulobacter sp. 17J65-9 TaxID=2709382 RepID=UPI0013CC35FB
MIVRHIQAVVLAAIVGCTALATQAQAKPDPRGGVLVKTWGIEVYDFHYTPSVPDPWFIYEGAMSGRLGPIETEASYSNAKETVTVVRRWERVDGFDACAAASEADNSLYSSAPAILLDQREADDLVSGRCVVGRLVPRVTARYVAYRPRRHYKALVLAERRTGRKVAYAPGEARPSIWDLFGLDAPKKPEGPDEVRDDDLIQALGSVRRMRNAALEVLWYRLDLSSEPQAALRERRPSSRAVGAALAASGLLESADPDLRARAMR